MRSIHSKQKMEEIFTLNMQEVANCIEKYCEKFGNAFLINFWLNYEEYLNLSKKVAQFLMPFVTIYLWKTGFCFPQNKYRNRLDVKPDMRIKLTFFPLNLEFLCNDKHHPSH